MNHLPSSRQRHVGAVSRYTDQRLAAGHVSFSLDELLQATDLSVSAARSQLHRLRPKIVRVSARDTFFLIVTPEYLSRGAPPVEWWIGDYFKWLGRPYYLALQTAARLHGSNPQSIQTTQVMTDRARKPLTVGQQKVQFTVKRHIEKTLVQSLPNAFAPTKVSTPAATAFDLVRYAPRIGGIGRAWETMRPLLARIEPSALRTELKAENEISNTQRLGFLLERAGQTKLADTVAALLPPKLPAIPLAVPASALTGEPVPRWRVIDNSGEFIQ
ncbi:MAG TPA: type IV toxin-antitoxin system AbiEi family antitoxin [Opitutaceae bacterium]|jgi:hypothetical protein